MERNGNTPGDGPYVSAARRRAGALKLDLIELPANPGNLGGARILGHTMVGAYSHSKSPETGFTRFYFSADTPDWLRGATMFHEIGHHTRHLAGEGWALGGRHREVAEPMAWYDAFRMMAADGLDITPAIMAFSAYCLQGYGFPKIGRDILEGRFMPALNSADNIRPVIMECPPGMLMVGAPTYIKNRARGRVATAPRPRPQGARTASWPGKGPTGGRTITARYAGTCADCGRPVAPGDVIAWYGRGRVYHRRPSCPR